MIERLDQLTIKEFVDLICGDTGVLVRKGEFVNPEKLAKAKRDIVFEYRMVTDKIGAASDLSVAEKMVKASISAVVFGICHNLTALKEFRLVRSILHEYGVGTESMDDARITAEVKSRYERAKMDIDKSKQEMGKHESYNGNIRDDFDAQTAALMAHFKFQIDTAAMKASVYAHLVARYHQEVKAMLDAAKKRV